MREYKRYWLALVAVLVVCFSILGYYGIEVYRNSPPVVNFTDENGKVVINKRRLFILFSFIGIYKICNFFTMNMQILHNINVNSGNISIKLFHTKKGKNMQMNFMHKVAKIGLVASLFAALSLSAADSARSITDMQGVKVSVPEKVEKIAALWHANNEIILALGGMDKVVTTTDLIKKTSGLYTYIQRLRPPKLR